MRYLKTARLPRQVTPIPIFKKRAAVFCFRPAIIFSLFLLFTATSCIEPSRYHFQAPAGRESDSVASSESNRLLVNINTASAKELERLPGIGKGLAQRIIDHRTEHGDFRRPEHLMMIRGIGEHRYRALRPFVTVE